MLSDGSTTAAPIRGPSANNNRSEVRESRSMQPTPQEQVQDEEAAFGDKITNKGDGILRIGFQNFNGLTGKENDPADVSLHRWITSMEFDVFGVSEVNMYWPNVKQSLQFIERVHRWWNPRNTVALCAYNKNEKRIKRSIRQYGGTAQISRGNAALQHVNMGRDPTGLGRWVWQRYMGKEQRVLRVITCYRPLPAHSDKIYTPFRQQRAFLTANMGRDIDPRDAVLEDLSIDITQWIEEGEHIILQMDANEDVREDKIKEWAEQMGLREAILERHGSTKAPKTHVRGRKPIDGIFVSRSLEIVAGGYTAFDDGVKAKRADHRCLWIDIKHGDVFGYNMPSPTKFAGRRVKKQDPRTTQAFNKEYKKFAIRTGLSKRIFQLEAKATYPLPETLRQEADSISKLRQAGIRHADKKCRRLHMGGAAYTPEFSRLMGRLRFYDYMVINCNQQQGNTGRNPRRQKSKRQRRKVGKSTLLRQYRIGKFQTTFEELESLSLEQLQTRAKEAYTQYRNYWDHCEEARSTWLEQLAKAREEEADRTRRGTGTLRRRRETKTKAQRTATQLRTLKKEEWSRRFFSRIKRAVGKDALQGVTMVIAPEKTDKDGNVTQWKECTAHDDITEALIKTHHAKYHQTEDSPPMTYPVQNQLGYLGIGRHADNILNGEYTPIPGTDKFSKRLLTQLKRVPEFSQEEETGISTDAFQRGWTKMKERTSAGGQALHFGHCKAIAMDDELSAMEAAFLSIPMKSGYSYSLWAKGVDCVLPKKKRQLRVDKLRTIVLFEADFNFLNKHVARKLAARAERNKDGLAPEQYGSRKFLRAIDHVLNKELSFDLLRQNKTPGIVIPTDLKSCYDRICHAIASLSMRRQGIAESEVVCMFTPLQHLEHTIRCAFGTSTESYGKELWAVPMQGVYQGNGAGPVIWAVVSSPLLQILKEEGFGTFFKAGISKTEIRLVGYAFVDDTDLIQTSKYPSQTFKEVLEEAQKALDWWEGLVRATGGALSVEKSRWWAVDFAWHTDGTWSYKQQVEIPGQLTGRDFDNLRKSVPRLDTNEAYETLGVFLAPDGTMDREYEDLTQKARRWADKLRTTTLREQETATALKATILKTLEYPLQATFLTKQQCDKLMRIILEAALPKAKFHRTFCRKTLYAPGSHGGQEIHNLKTSQTIAHLDGMLRHGMARSLAGQQLRGSIETAKVEIGIPGDLFSHSFKDYGTLATECWVKKVWKEAEETDIRIYERTKELQLRRQGDKFLIPAFKDGGFRNSTLVKLNLCRLRLQVITFADVVSGDGRFLLKEADGDTIHLRNSSVHWPNQGPLPPSYWRLWFKALKRILRVDERLRIRVPLGHWIDGRCSSHGAWYSPSTRQSFIRDNGRFQTFQHQPASIHQAASYRPAQTRDTIPSDAQPAVAWLRDGVYHYHGSCRSQQDTTTKPETLNEAIQALAPEWQWVFSYWEATIEPAELAHLIVQGEAKAITDGSCKNKKGTAAFAITTSDGTRGVYGMHKTPGNDEIQGSYRSETGGITGILLLVKLLHQTYDLTGGDLIAGCDNVEAGRRSIMFTSDTRPSEDHFDLVHANRTLHRELPFQLTYKHVEGHQRSKYPRRKLDVWAELNEAMDANAKAYWQYTQQWPVIQDIFPGEWKIEIDGDKVVQDFSKTLRRIIEGKALENKWTKAKRQNKILQPPKYTPEQLELMDSTAIQRAWQKEEGNRRRFVTKLTTNFLPTAYRLFQRKFWESNMCPCCKHEIETTEHVLRCPSPVIRAACQTALQGFDENLAKIRTAPNIAQGITAMVAAALAQDSLSIDSIEREDILAAIQDQLKLGLMEFIKGRICRRWSIIQDAAFKNYAPWLNGQQWAASLVSLLWTLCFQIWDGRNQWVHDTPQNRPDIDESQIDMAILEEWTVGCNDWRPEDASLFQGLSCEELLSRSITARQQWLYYVKTARDFHEGNTPL